MKPFQQRKRGTASDTCWMRTSSRPKSQPHNKNQSINRMQIPSHPRKQELITYLLPKTHKSSTLTIAHRITSVQVPDIRESNDSAHATLVTPTKTNEDSAAISLCYLEGRNTLPPPPTSHALARTQCMAAPANRALKWGM
ncbi:hypothetical protein CDAR_174391 [Caerostris darwini]|uniref:Uncharacterized protein n=1 Tax=Caerostris darwini TaxID=1538125 RepID=A0AAV4PD95_9ARAC|nr:hypothetical protein CDAR_174391 [Caerostris darwini]